MATTSNSTPTKFHPKLRRKVLASAEARLFQVQVIGSKGQERSLAVYQCGPDVFYAETMDGLFDQDRRKTAPAWLVDGIAALPGERRFDHTGKPAIRTTAAAVADLALPAPTPKAPQVRPAELADEDAPSFSQA